MLAPPSPKEWSPTDFRYRPPPTPRPLSSSLVTGDWLITPMLPGPLPKPCTDEMAVRLYTGFGRGDIARGIQPGDIPGATIRALLTARVLEQSLVNGADNSFRVAGANVDPRRTKDLLEVLLAPQVPNWQDYPELEAVDRAGLAARLLLALSALPHDSGSSRNYHITSDRRYRVVDGRLAQSRGLPPGWAVRRTGDGRLELLQQPPLLHPRRPNQLGRFELTLPQQSKGEIPSTGGITLEQAAMATRESLLAAFPRLLDTVVPRTPHGLSPAQLRAWLRVWSEVLPSQDARIQLRFLQENRDFTFARQFESDDLEAVIDLKSYVLAYLQTQARVGDDALRLRPRVTFADVFVGKDPATARSLGDIYSDAPRPPPINERAVLAVKASLDGNPNRDQLLGIMETWVDDRIQAIHAAAVGQLHVPLEHRGSVILGPHGMGKSWAVSWIKDLAAAVGEEPPLIVKASELLEYGQDNQFRYTKLATLARNQPVIIDELATVINSPEGDNLRSAIRDAMGDAGTAPIFLLGYPEVRDWINGENGLKSRVGQNIVVLQPLRVADIFGLLIKEAKKLPEAEQPTLDTVWSFANYLAYFEVRKPGWGNIRTVMGKWNEGRSDAVRAARRIEIVSQRPETPGRMTIDHLVGSLDPRRAEASRKALLEFADLDHGDGKTPPLRDLMVMLETNLKFRALLRNKVLEPAQRGVLERYARGAATLDEVHAVAEAFWPSSSAPDRMKPRHITIRREREDTDLPALLKVLWHALEAHAVILPVSPNAEFRMDDKNQIDQLSVGDFKEYIFQFLAEIHKKAERSSVILIDLSLWHSALFEDGDRGGGRKGALKDALDALATDLTQGTGGPTFVVVGTKEECERLWDLSRPFALAVKRGPEVRLKGLANQDDVRRSVRQWMAEHPHVRFQHQNVVSNDAERVVEYLQKRMKYLGEMGSIEVQSFLDACVALAFAESGTQPIVITTKHIAAAAADFEYSRVPNQTALDAVGVLAEHFLRRLNPTAGLGDTVAAKDEELRVEREIKALRSLRSALDDMFKENPETMKAMAVPEVLGKFFNTELLLGLVDGEGLGSNSGLADRLRETELLTLYGRVGAALQVLESFSSRRTVARVGAQERGGPNGPVAPFLSGPFSPGRSNQGPGYNDYTPQASTEPW